MHHSVTLEVEYLGWADLGLACSTNLLGQERPTSRGELPKSASTQPRYSTIRVTLYDNNRRDYSPFQRRRRERESGETINGSILNPWLPLPHRRLLCGLFISSQEERESAQALIIITV